MILGRFIPQCCSQRQYGGGCVSVLCDIRCVVLPNSTATLFFDVECQAMNRDGGMYGSSAVEEDELVGGIYAYACFWLQL